MYKDTAREMKNNPRPTGEAQLDHQTFMAISWCVVRGILVRVYISLVSPYSPLGMHASMRGA